MVRWKVRTETRQYAADSDVVRSCDEIDGVAWASMGRHCRAGDELCPTRSPLLARREGGVRAK